MRNSRRAALSSGGEPLAERAQPVASAPECLLERHALEPEVHLRRAARLAPQPLLRPFEGEPLVVQERFDAQDELEVFLAVQPLARGGLLGSQQLELGLPVAKHVGGNVRDRLDLADAVVELVRDHEGQPASNEAPLRVDPQLQALALLERQHLACGDLDAVAGLRIPPPPGQLLADAEMSEPDDLHVFTLLEAPEDYV